MKYNQELIFTIEKNLRKRLSPSRYSHTIGVAGCASTLAMCYNVDVHKAYIAGLLHDYSKEHTDKAFIELAKAEGMNLTQDEMDAPYLIHGKLAAIEVKRDYGIDDEDLLNSLRYHTSGRINMSMLEKIIYIADYIEPHRVNFKGIGEIRENIFINIDKAMYFILKDTINYLKKRDRVILNSTIDTLNYYKKIAF